MIAARDFGNKIKVENPVVDIDGDEMTKIIWNWIKEKVSKFFIFSSAFSWSAIVVFDFGNKKGSFIKINGG